MGNKICCEGANPHGDQDKIVIQTNHKKQEKTGTTGSSLKENQSDITMYPISQKIIVNLQKFSKSQSKLDPFIQKIDNTLPLRKYGDQIYQGQIDEQNRPDGYGKMVYKNGSVFIGEFKKGKACGSAYFFWPDGSYYSGLMNNNKANDKKGIYKCESFTYQGNFENNEMTGEGKQTGDKYSFIGLFQNGQRKNGKLNWIQYQMKDNQKKQINYQYQGQFDQNGNFTGDGTLISTKGKFKGKFKEGKKNGFGVFQNANGIRYEGIYKNDIKQGQGTIYLKSNRIAYSGEMVNGLPHGSGYVVGQNGQKTNLKWNQGISSIIMTEQQAKQIMNNLYE